MSGFLLLLLAACAAPPQARTPNCPAPTYPDSAALLAALPPADYACTEDLAAALSPYTTPQMIDHLLALAADPQPHARARRNALRVLGRLAEAGPGRDLLLGDRATATQQVLDQILASEDDPLILHEVIWIYDSAYFPAFSFQPALERIATEPRYDPALRTRAATALVRLLAHVPGLITPHNEEILTTSLASNVAGVRRSAALGIASLDDAQMSSAVRARFVQALAQVWQSEPALALPADLPDLPVESQPTSLSVQAAIAQAQDRLLGAQHLVALRTQYEAMTLPHTFEQGDLRVRSGLSSAELSAVTEHVGIARRAFVQIVGQQLATPIPGEPDAPIRLIIFAHPAIFRDYMRAFTPYPVDVDGVYSEAERTIYTHQRRADQRTATLGMTIQHEMAHALLAQSLFAGQWSDAGYHTQPKGWLDEGLAEVISMAQEDAAGEIRFAPPPGHIAALCRRSTAPSLKMLLEERRGYEQYGRFDYPAAWALSAYLIESHPAALQRLAAAYRDGSYRREDWGTLVGMSEAAFEARWHTQIGAWCGR